MKIIKRELQDIIEKYYSREILLPYSGPGRLAKQRWLRKFLKKLGHEKEYFNCDIISIRQVMQLKILKS